MIDYTGDFSNPIPLYYKKNDPVVNEIDNLDQKLDLLTSHLGKFPDNLRIMSLILLTTGIKKGQLFLLRNADFYYENENSWMKNWRKRRFNIMQKWKTVWEELC